TAAYRSESHAGISPLTATFESCSMGLPTVPYARSFQTRIRDRRKHSGNYSARQDRRIAVCTILGRLEAKHFDCIGGWLHPLTGQSTGRHFTRPDESEACCQNLYEFRDSFSC